MVEFMKKTDDSSSRAWMYLVLDKVMARYILLLDNMMFLVD